MYVRRQKMKLILKVKEKGFIKSFIIAYKKIKPKIIPGYQKLIVFETMIKNKYTEINLKKGIEIDIIKNSDELKEFGKKRGDWYYDYAKDTLSKGNYCFVAKVDGKIAGCLWIVFNQFYFNELQYNLKVDDNIALLIDAFTLDEYRRMGLQRILWEYCVNFLIGLDKYDRAQVHILYKNKRSLMTHSNLVPDTMKVLEIILIKGFGLRFHIVKKY